MSTFDAFVLTKGDDGKQHLGKMIVAGPANKEAIDQKADHDN